MANILYYRSEHEGKERTREEQGEDTDEVHDDRIQKLEDTAQTTRNRIAWCNRKYNYDEQIEEAAQQKDEQAENGSYEVVCIEIYSDSDSDQEQCVD